ncbi:MAG: hypothetical protein KDI90_03975 [Alphaproteobacteria bacterium]|nr:hypothetical protein [Alphaproteobacteria bacterium]MCB9975910.1 hypothetical protein [Rhodospirillales bacterium]
MTPERAQSRRKGFASCCVVALVFCSAPLLSGCGFSKFELTTGAIAAATQGLFSDPKVNLREKNYAAADYLLQQSGNYLNRTGIIEAQPLTESDNPAAVSELGRQMADEMGQRFAELGYNVNRMRVSNEVDKSIFAATGQVPPQFILSGSYRKKKEKLEVYLRIVETASSRIVSSFNYTMPYSSEIRRLAEADAQIIRLKQP